MIDFACKKFSIDEVIKCSLALTKADYKTLIHLANNSDDWLSTEDIAKKLKLDITTIQRAVKKLTEKEMINRKQMNLEGGGYTFIYQIKNKKIMREKIMSIIKQWTSKVEEQLKKW
jgi:predicted transcriptional regulator